MNTTRLPQNLLGSMHIEVSYYADFYRRREANHDLEVQGCVIGSIDWPDETGMRKALREKFPRTGISIISIEEAIHWSKYGAMRAGQDFPFDVDIVYGDDATAELEALTEDVEE